MTRTRGRKGLATLIAAAAFGAVPPVLGCGFEDPAAVSLGALNLAYPNALHVGPSVWQARQDGLLERTTSLPTGPAAHWAALRALDQLRQRWPAGAPPVAIVLVPAVMWSRLLTQDEAVVLQVHVAGPVANDLVLVTEPDALGAWMAGRLASTVMLERGLLRTYGEAAGGSTLREILLALSPPS